MNDMFKLGALWGLNIDNFHWSIMIGYGNTGSNKKMTPYNSLLILWMTILLKTITYYHILVNIFSDKDIILKCYIACCPIRKPYFHEKYILEM
jgi:hypothetical protein